MRKLRLFLAVVVLATLSFTNVHARAVGDKITGYIPGTSPKQLDKCTYRIMSLVSSTGEDSLTVSIVGSTLTGHVTFPVETVDSTGTRYKVTSLHENVRKETEFTNRTGITEITFQEGFLQIYGIAFHIFPNLTTVNFPKSLSHWYGRPFYSGAQKATTITVVEGGRFKAVNGALYSANGDTLWCYPPAKTAATVRVPDGVTTLERGAFIYNYNITKIQLPQSCKTLKDASVFGCSNLASFELLGNNPHLSIRDNLWPDGTAKMLCNYAGDTLLYYPPAQADTLVRTPGTWVIMDNAFSNCSKIRHVQLQGVREIKNNAFSTCTALKDVAIGTVLREFNGMNSFQSCSNLTKFIYYNTTSENPNFRIINDALYSRDGSVLYKIPPGLTSFTIRSTTTAALPTKTTVIGYGAGAYGRLQSINIPANIEKIDACAFQVSPLQSVTFNGNNLKVIGNNAFAHKSNAAFSSITIPASVDSIGDYAFYTTPNLKTITIADNSNLKYIGPSAFRLSGLTAFNYGPFSSSTLYIGAHAFRENTNFTSFVFPEHVSHLGESAFNGCTSLRSVLFGGEMLDTIGVATFQNTALISITLPSSVKWIGNHAFNSCQQLKTVSIPAATTYVGPQAFLFCGQLTAINVNKANTKYSSVDGMLASKDKRILYTFPAGKAATYYTMLSPSFEVINDSAFYYNRQLKSVTIPKKVTKIGAHAFALCDKLERINFLNPSPMSDVHSEAFIDMDRNSRLPEIDLYVRDTHGDAYRYHSVWGAARSFNEGFKANRVEFLPMSATDASIVDVQSDATTFVVPKTVTNTDDNKTYDVKLIGDYAFEDCSTDIEEVVVPSDVTLNYIGARAFAKNDATLKPIKSVFVVSSTPTELATSAFGLKDAGVTGNYDEVDASQKIYVKKSAESTFKTAWPTMADRIDYKIPGISISKTYGTFAREFDVDLSDYSQDAANNGKGKVWAFVAGDGVLREGTGNGNVDGEYYVKMHSINEGQEGDGTYIPAGTGVLLKAADGTPATPANYHYVIGEKDVNAAVSGSDVLMKGVTVKPLTVTNIDGRIYVMQGGLFRKLPTNGDAVEIPAHRAYLELPAVAAGAKVMFYFGNDPVPSAIEALGLDEGAGMMDESPVYDLQGRKVSGNATLKAGIYVKNGKKFVVK